MYHVKCFQMNTHLNGDYKFLNKYILMIILIFGLNSLIQACRICSLKPVHNSDLNATARHFPEPQDHFPFHRSYLVLRQYLCIIVFNIAFELFLENSQKKR